MKDTHAMTNRFSPLSCSVGAGIDMFRTKCVLAPKQQKERPVSTPPNNIPLGKTSQYPITLPLYIRSLSNKTSTKIPIHLSTLKTQDTTSTTALIDCGATGIFIDKDFVAQQGFETQALDQAILVYNVNGTRNEGGSIREVTDLQMCF